MQKYVSERKYPKSDHPYSNTPKKVTLPQKYPKYNDPTPLLLNVHCPRPKTTLIIFYG